VSPAALAAAYCIASRLVYVLFVGIALRRQERSEAYTRRWGVARGFQRFRRLAMVLMGNDVLAFAVLCVVTRGTLTLGVPRVALIATGVALVAIGVSVKIWAAATLGGDAYYWYNFFAPPAKQHVVLAGPYRFLANPMYTVGYLQAYGFALITGSLVGLYVAAFLQLAILVFYYAVEKPHFERLNGSRR
jgi:protein-S-isoprenylcysteine O-methyltransferase Ste14